MIPSSGGGDGGARLLTFNVNNQESYDFLVEDILNGSQNSYLTWYIIGINDEQVRVISYEEGMELARQYSATYFEVSVH